MPSSILFILVLITGFYFFFKQTLRIRRNILLGTKHEIEGPKKERWQKMLLLAVGQKKMFDKPIVGILHLLVYAGFIIINTEIIEIIIDGIFGTHRFLARFIPSGLYNFIINTYEIFAFLTILACAVFLIRRNILKIPRLDSADLKGFPRIDANIILITEIVLMSAFLIYNAADSVLVSKNVEPYSNFSGGNYFLSTYLFSFLQNCSITQLVFIEKVTWWIHIIGILLFLNYLPISKHLHILLAFPNTYFTSLSAKGKMQNMPSVEAEVRYAMNPNLPAPPPASTFGAKDIMDLSWKNLLDAYTCTECGRCTAQCPANLTGKALSPRLIMMKTRDRVTEVGNYLDKNGSLPTDEKTLLNDYITVEELNACTTCNACVEACPVSISPLAIIYQLRRYLVMEAATAPAEWNAMFGNIENNFAPWKFSPADRANWTEN